MAQASYRVRFVRRLGVGGVLLGLTYLLGLPSWRIVVVFGGLLLLEGAERSRVWRHRRGLATRESKR
jgi:hypothetical protein